MRNCIFRDIMWYIELEVHGRYVALIFRVGRKGRVKTNLKKAADETERLPLFYASLTSFSSSFVQRVLNTRSDIAQSLSELNAQCVFTVHSATLHSHCLLTGKGGYFLAMNLHALEAHHLPISRIGVKNAWSCTSTSPYTLCYFTFYYFNPRIWP
jgi:hypothetical protein